MRQETFYGGGGHGYTDYPRSNRAAPRRRPAGWRQPKGPARAPGLA
jgi:hypothetical protein